MVQAGIGDRIRYHLDAIYREIPFPGYLFKKLMVSIKDVASQCKNNQQQKLSEKDVFLICYGDSIFRDNQKPLETLYEFLTGYLEHTINHVHILPFFPYSSDDGFSVIDYYEVNPLLGSWQNIRKISKYFELMADLVINHISRESIWFRNFLNDREPGNSYFITLDPGTDLSMVVRPRTSPLLTGFETTSGVKYVWTTFSADQIDLNYSDPALLTEMMEIFLFYISQGIRIIRLDAIAYLWKTVGTSCIHLPQTHEIVKLMRTIADAVDPSIILITETNVPETENYSYFGTGDEANMVYQFSLPPLLLHALHTADTQYLTRWAENIPILPKGCTFFNFTASHDGIGVRPLEGLLPAEEIQDLVRAMKEYGGYISTRSNSDGSESPYELNITYYDALKFTSPGKDKLQTERFICSQTIMMSMKGVPAFYIHSLLGTTNDYEGVKRTGLKRSINRKKWNADELNQLLAGDTSDSVILNELVRRITIRKKIKAFHPDAPQKVYNAGKEFFILVRGVNQQLIVIASFSSLPTVFHAHTIDLSVRGTTDLITGQTIAEDTIKLEPYQVMWIEKKL